MKLKLKLSPKKINLPKETQQPSNLRRKIPHQDQVTPSKHPRLENIIDSDDNEQFLNGIQKHENQDHARIDFHNDMENHSVMMNS